MMGCVEGRMGTGGEKGRMSGRRWEKKKGKGEGDLMKCCLGMGRTLKDRKQGREAAARTRSISELGGARGGTFTGSRARRRARLALPPGCPRGAAPGTAPG
jgi:hypothetical protein